MAKDNKIPQSFRLPPDLKKEIDEYAERNHVTFSVAATMLLWRGLQDVDFEKRAVEEARKKRYADTSDEERTNQVG